MEPWRCAGHFEVIRALPVAILSSALTRASALLIDRLEGMERAFAVGNADLRAKNLALAGESVEIEARLVEEVSGGARIEAWATGTHGRRFAELDVELERFAPQLQKQAV